MKSKKGVELGMNFVVILILSIVAFGFGLTFLYKIVNAGNNLPDFSPVEQVINSKMAGGERVVAYPSSATLKSGQKEIFGVGVLNTDAPQQFRVKLETNGNLRIISSASNNEIDFQIGQNEDRKISFIVDSKGATKGVHEITVTVSSGNPLSQYDTKKKVYVTVT